MSQPDAEIAATTLEPRSAPPAAASAIDVEQARGRCREAVRLAYRGQRDRSFAVLASVSAALATPSLTSVRWEWLYAKAHLRLLDGGIADALDSALRARALAAALDAGRAPAWARCNALVAHVRHCAGDPLGAARAAIRALEVAVDTGEEHAILSCCLVLAATATRARHATAAARLLGRAVVAASREQDPGAQVAVAVQACVIESETVRSKATTTADGEAYAALLRRIDVACDAARAAAQAHALIELHLLRAECLCASGRVADAALVARYALARVANNTHRGSVFAARVVLARALLDINPSRALHEIDVVVEQAQALNDPERLAALHESAAQMYAQFGHDAVAARHTERSDVLREANERLRTALRPFVNPALELISRNATR